MGRVMPITPFLYGKPFDPETRRVMGLAFEMARAALRLDTTDFATEILAKKIIELAKSGEADPNELCERALEHFRISASAIASSPSIAPRTGAEPE